MIAAVFGRKRKTRLAALSLLLSSLLLLVSTLADLLYGRKMLKQSAAFARGAVDHATARAWMALFGDHWQKASTAIAVGALFCLRAKGDALLLFFAYCFAQTFGIVSKMIYQELRPCHFDPLLAARSCICTFGKVSHSTLVVTSVALSSSLLLPATLPTTLRVAGRTFAVFVALNVGLGRVFYGAHGLNQVVLGWFWGLWISAAFALLRAVHAETINGFLLREPRFEGAKRRFHFCLFGFFLALNIAGLESWRRSGDSQPGMGIVHSACFEACTGTRGLMDEGLRELGSRNWGLPFALVWAVTDPPRTLPNSFFYLQSVKSATLFAKRTLIFTLTTLPLVAALLLVRFGEGFPTFWACSSLGLLFVLLFFFVAPWLLEHCGADLSGDFFTGGRPLLELEAPKSRTLALSTSAL